jgi:orotidine-5'-phosphate decarboxylase
MNPLLKVRNERGPLFLSLDIVPRVYEYGVVKERREELKERVASIMKEVGSLVSGFEIGLPLLLAMDPLTVAELIEGVRAEHSGISFLLRCRVVDFDHSNRVLASHAFELGFDGIITQVFTGYSGSLDGILEEARAREKAVIGTVILGNPGAGKLFNSHYKDMVSLCVRAKLDGVEVAGSVLEAVRAVRRITPRDIAVICSAVPPNKLVVKKLVLCGADLVIMGRGILTRPDTKIILSEILREVKG